MRTFRFFDFPVYNEAKNFYKKIFVVTEGIRDYSLVDQIRRVALSIILNIAEGSAKKSDKEFARFLETSLASVNEVVACLDVMHDRGLISKDKYSGLLVDAEKIARQLGGFIKTLYRKVNSQ